MPITPKLGVEVEMGSVASGLVLAECYQAQGRDDEAIALLQQMAAIAPGRAFMVSLCELLAIEAGVE
jgi:hypothetical protein